MKTLKLGTMKLYLTLFLLFSFNSILGQIPSGVFTIHNDFVCGIREGAMRIRKPQKSKFSFAIAVDGEITNEKFMMQGRVKGIASIINKKKAIFKGKGMTLVFYFTNPNVVEITEYDSGSLYYHGANICFSGKYLIKNEH